MNQDKDNNMEAEKKEKIEKIAAEIIQMSKNRLLVNMRFMDMSLNQFRIAPNPEITPFPPVMEMSMFMTQYIF